MRKLVIKNIGAIGSVNINLNRVNVFIGPQSSGKSTISKILCHCMWVEKDCFLDAQRLEQYLKTGVFYDSLIEYHRIEGYFKNSSSFKYTGDYLTISYNHKSGLVMLKVNKPTKYYYPKIGYMPSERNLVTSISNFGKYNEGNNVILYFGYDWNDAKNDIQKLSMGNILERDIVYEHIDDKDFIFDNGGRLPLRNASSGVLSLLPLFAVANFLCNRLYKKDRILSANKRSAMEDTIQRIHNAEHILKECKVDDNISKNEYDFLRMLSDSINSPFIEKLNTYQNRDINKLQNAIRNIIIDISRIFDYKYTQLFIEEPEQNLFPRAQMRFINELLMMLSIDDMSHCAVVTTHSPYILFEINNAIMRYLVRGNISDDIRSELLNNKAIINPKEISIYQIENGELKQIQDIDGMVSKNYLDDVMKEIMNEYYGLLDYYGEDE